MCIRDRHWGVVRSRRLFRERNEKANKSDLQLTVSQKYGLLPQAEFMEKEGRRIVVVQKGHDILKRTMPGDFVISMRSFQGGLEISEYEGSVSCLLYTSPSPRDRTRSRMPSSA